MSDLKVYEVEINGNRTTVQLTDADAKERGLTRANLAKARPAAKAGAVANKADAAAVRVAAAEQRLAAAEEKLAALRAADKPSAAAITKAETELAEAQAEAEAAAGS